MGRNSVHDATLLSLVHDLVLRAHADGRLEDFIQLLLLDGVYIDLSVLLNMTAVASRALGMRLTVIASQGLVQGDLIEPFVPRCGDRPGKDINKIVLLNNI